MDLSSLKGTWDYKESRIWINDEEILPPTWIVTQKDNELTMVVMKAIAILLLIA